MCLSLEQCVVAGGKKAFQLLTTSLRFWALGFFFWRPAWKTFFSFTLARIELPVNFLPCYTECFLKCSKWRWPFKACTPLLSEEEGEVSFVMPLKFSGSHCFLQCSYTHGALLCNHSFWTAASYLQSELYDHFVNAKLMVFSVPFYIVLPFRAAVRSHFKQMSRPMMPQCGWDMQILTF